MRASENPFRVERIHALAYRLQGSSWPELMARFETLGRRAAIVGLPGSGKTTLLAEIVARLEGDGIHARRWKLDDDSPRPGVRDLRAWLEPATPNTVVVVDGAEFLRWRARRWLLRATRECAGLLVTTHRGDFLPMLLWTSTSVVLLAEITTELLGGGRRLDAELVMDLYSRHVGDIRRCLFELYDRAARDDPEVCR